MSASRLAAVAGCVALVGVSGCAFGAPKPTTGVSLTGATLHGDVYSSFDGNTEYWWRYGGTTGYGSETPHRTIAIDDESAHPVSEPLTGLSPNTTYHFQLCARDGEESPPRTNCSTDQKFSTNSAIGASRIAFIRFDGTDSDIFVMSPTGAGATAVTTDSTSYEGGPAWSPDAGRLAFHSDQGANWDIRTIGANGVGNTRLTTDPGLDWQADWSPDGSKIAFVSQRGTPEHDEIYVMDADGTDVVRLTNAAAGSAEPVWSPDGSQIAFTRGGTLYTINATGGTPTALPGGVQGGDPDWSPDGTKIAFTTSLGTNTTDIFVIDSDGSDLTRLTRFPGYDRFPTWSPDGRKIAFGRRGGTAETTDEIWVMDADGSDDVQLTSNSLIDIQPDWSRVPAAPSAR